MVECPCCSRTDFEDCCEPYITGKTTPCTALALMRSRYTAYSRQDINYIIKTWAPAYRRSLNIPELRAWAESAEFTGLEIHSTKLGKKNDESGMVEFSAHYITDGHQHTIHEKSAFQKIDNQWYYLAAESDLGTKNKISRNAACPCGSGKKYKKCCKLNKST